MTNRTAALALMLGLWLALGAHAEPPSRGAHPTMTQPRIEAILRSLAPDAKGVGGSLAFRFAGVDIEYISDAQHDRMRLIAVVAPVSELSGESVARILEANFHSALDARYATSRGYLYAAFIHPLSPLTEAELKSAVSQVANLAKTFGSSYSSGELIFQGDRPPI